MADPAVHELAASRRKIADRPAVLHVAASSSRHEKPAFYIERLACHRAGIGAAEKKHHPSDLPRFNKAVHRFSALDPSVGLAFGVDVIYQELDLVPDMSVAENIFLGHEPHRRFGVLNRAAMQERARGLLDHFDHPIDPRERVRNLGPAERQLVQIARTLSREGIRILVLDEPTATLTPHEVDRLFQLLGRFRERGLGLVYISHRLEEVRRIGDHVTVLRDGEIVLTAVLADVSGDEIITAMVGRKPADASFRVSSPRPDVALAVEGLSRQGEFDEVSFSVRSGEVLALAGLIGAGRTEVLETIFGVRRPDRGLILIGDQPVELNSPSPAIRFGIGLVPEDRRKSGLVLGRSILDNLIYPILDRISTILRLDQDAVTMGECRATVGRQPAEGRAPFR